MQNIIESVRKSIELENLYSALFVSLTIPDICVALDQGKTSGTEYSKWFETNVYKYKDRLSGNDCYALRCSVLHQGIDDITDQSKKDVLEQCVFLSDGAHLNLFNNCSFNGVEKSFLQLNVKIFCEDMCVAAETWLAKNSNNINVQRRLIDTLEIHKPGHTYMGLIRFG